MKSIPPIILMMLLYCVSSGQHVAISNDRLNVAYVGISTPLAIVVEGCNPKLVNVSTDNGILERGVNSVYHYYPAKEGKAIFHIAIKGKNGIKEIGQAVYQVKLLPRPTVKINGRFDGRFISLDAINGISASIDNFDIEAYFSILDFKIDIIKKQLTVFRQTNNGDAFSDAVKKEIAKMEPGDRIRVYEIHCKSPDNRVLTLRDVTETIYLN